MKSRFLLAIITFIIAISALGIIGCNGIYACNDNYNVDDDTPIESSGINYVKEGYYYICKDIGSAKCNDIVIATIHEELPVKAIAQEAFKGCTNIETIYISANITSIGGDAFSGCTNLESITYNGTKAQWDAIIKAFNWDANTGNYVIHCTDGDI